MVMMCACQFHECFCRICRVHGVADVSQSEFLSLCQNVEAQGIFSLKTTRDTRSAKVRCNSLSMHYYQSIRQRGPYQNRETRQKTDRQKKQCKKLSAKSSNATNNVTAVKNTYKNNTISTKCQEP